MRLPTIVVIVVIVGLIAVSQSGASSQGNAAEPEATLHVGVPVERKLEGGETHVYRFYLQAGQYAHVLIEQWGMIPIARLRRPGGPVIEELSRQYWQTHDGVDRLVVVADEDTEYRLELSNARKVEPGRGGTYTVRLAELGQASPTERTRLAAQLSAADAIRENGHALSAESIRKLEASLTTSRDLDDPLGEVTTLMALGLGHWLGDRRQSLPYFSEAAVIARRAGQPWAELEALNDLGEIANTLGDPRQSIEHGLRALTLIRQLARGDPDPLYIHNLAVAYREIGEFQVALHYAHDALSGWHDIGDVEGQAFAGYNIGMIHLLLGDAETALSYFTEALKLWRSLDTRNWGVAQALTLTGTARASLGDHRAALQDFREAIRFWHIAGGPGSPDISGEGRAMNRMAISLAALGEWPEAVQRYEAAIALFRSAGTRSSEADALRSLGDARYAMGDARQAAELYAQALPIHRTSENRAGEAATLLGLARVARDRQQLDDALANIERALDLIEGLRTTVSSRDLRASFIASKRDYYDFYVDLLMRLHARNPAGGYAEAALVANERGRARSLMDTIIEGGADIREGVPSALLARERALEQDLTNKAALLTRILGGPHTEPEAAAVQSELRGITQAYDDTQARIREESPRYAALTQPPPLDLAAIRDRLLDDHTVLLEYALGAERSYLWIVTRGSLAVHQLPKRADIDAAAREAYQLFAASDQREAWGPTARASARLSNLLLGPVAGELRTRRLLIVADGALHYVPFAALPHPHGGDPLIATNEVVSLPSASALAVLRGEMAGRARAAKAVAVLADPVLEASDPRVRSGRTPIEGAPYAEELLRSANESGIPRFARLQFTREEADAIVRVAGRANVLYSVDFNASRATATGSSLADYRIVHFATHGLINNQHPDLSGLVLSLVDSDGNAQDGFVRLRDIYNLKLNADLVVLSACRTALGKDVRGEGLVGLTRGFMYAGAPRVVASLWDVRDRATAELMTRFYSRMLTDGLSPAAALRAAQVSMWKEPRWQAPFNWAGFVIQGEWK